ncbi:MAG: BT_3928 family protein [Spirosomataceae bacterium]
MLKVAHIARILVGVEFIFSGFVKVVDPYGTGLKLQEYFEVFATDLPAFSSFFTLLAHQSQLLSLIFCASELILGVALLFSFQMKKTAWIVLAFMTFFTFLTFYSAFFNKVTDCGCFGDFLKLKPWHSFYKDIISMAVILVFFIYRDAFKTPRISHYFVIGSSIISFAIGLYAINFLPPLDFLAYAKGNNIQKLMEPTGVKPDIVYIFQDKVNNKKIESREYLMDSNFEYIESYTTNEDEITPKITDYSLSDTLGNDWTTTSFEGNKILITFKKVKTVHRDTWKRIEQLYSNTSKNPSFDIVFVTSDVPQYLSDELKKRNIQAPIFTIDEKVLKTMARVNPVVYFLQNGTVINKWGYRTIPEKITRTP